MLAVLIVASSYKSFQPSLPNKEEKEEKEEVSAAVLQTASF